jgi:hypothetical protein
VTTAIFGLLVFVVATLTFLFMHHFYQPVAVPEKDPRLRERKTYHSIPEGKLEHIRNSFTTIHTVSEAIMNMVYWPYIRNTEIDKN